MVLPVIESGTGNLLDAEAEALVNTVNCVGVMGKGVALMFREAFPKNYRSYRAACKAGELRPGGLFVHRTNELVGPRLIVNFATKDHWRGKSRMEWIESGLAELATLAREEGVRSIALPPLGAGNGGLDWNDVRPRIDEHLGELEGVRVIVFEPTDEYRNVSKRAGIETLTPARATMAGLLRRYEVLGFECSLLEMQKLAWFAERSAAVMELHDCMELRFEAGRYGPYSHRLTHLLDGLDGSYLHSDIRIPDAKPFDVVRCRYDRSDRVEAFLRTSEANGYGAVVEKTDELIDGFQSPFGMELLATVDWLLHREGCAPEVPAIADAIAAWPAGPEWGQRKRRIFDDRVLGIALERLQSAGM